MFDGCLRFYLTTSGLSFLCFRVTYVLYLNNFEDADDGDRFNTFQTIEKNAGRIEKRICRKARDIAWLAAHKWPGLRSVFAVERIVDVRGMLSKETSYYISSSDVSARGEQSVNTGKSNPCIGF